MMRGLRGLIAEAPRGRDVDIPRATKIDGLSYARGRVGRAPAPRGLIFRRRVAAPPRGASWTFRRRIAAPPRDATWILRVQATTVEDTIERALRKVASQLAKGDSLGRGADRLGHGPAAAKCYDLMLHDCDGLPDEDCPPLGPGRRRTVARAFETR